MGIRENLLKMLEQGPDSALLRYSLGNEYLKGGDAADAVEHLQCAVRIDPAYSAAWKLLGKALAATGDHLAARAAFDDGIRVAEERGDVQAAKEMKVFRRRSDKALAAVG